MDVPAQIAPIVAVVLGSKTDRGLVDDSGMKSILVSMGIECDISYISAHRNPEKLTSYVAQSMKEVDVYIAAAGMAAALPGAIAANSGALIPVIGVALPSSEFPNCMDALLSMTRMPPGMPVMVTGAGISGLKNAAIAAAQIIAIKSPEVKEKLQQYITKNTKPAQISVG